MISIHTRLAALLAFSLLGTPAIAGTWYVDANLASGANDGSGWNDAFQGPDGLQLALSAAASGDRIFVAEGRYLPTSSGARDVSFLLKPGVEVYGGFAGGESSPDERPPLGVAPSVLDGDLAGDDGSGSFSENSLHVVDAGGAGTTAVLDGFVVRGGNANGTEWHERHGGGLFCRFATPLIRSCRFIENRSDSDGGAVWVNLTGATFLDCRFEGNFSGGAGGAIMVQSSSAPLTVDRCAFTGNVADAAGALLLLANSPAVISNSLFESNAATQFSGGAIFISSGITHTIAGCTIAQNVAHSGWIGGVDASPGSVEIVNTILWNNAGFGTVIGAANQVTTGVQVRFSIVTGGYSGIGNLALDPQLDGNWMPTAASPGIDAGRNGGVPSGQTLDLARAPRFVDAPSVPDTGAGSAPVTDIGAFEYAEVIGTPYCFGDGSGTACPCANAGASGEGCATSAGSGGLLGASGSASVGSDDLVLLGTQLLPGQPALFFVGTSQVGGGNGVVFGDGLRCAGGNVLRLGVALPDGGGTASFGPGLAGAGGWSPGDTRHFQIWFRDPGGPCGTGFNLSNALSITFQ